MVYVTEDRSVSNYIVILVFLWGVVFLITIIWLHSCLPGTCLAIEHSFSSPSIYLPTIADTTVFAIPLLFGIHDL
jgi:hypothetical protein